jgi:hypothetical protein
MQKFLHASDRLLDGLMCHSCLQYVPVGPACADGDLPHQQGLLCAQVELELLLIA